MNLMIRYRIIDYVDEIKNKSIELLKKDNEIYGMFNIQLNNNEIGFFVDEDSLPLSQALEEDIFTYHDCLFIWFISINKVLNLLEKYNIVKLLDIESLNYGYIFKKEGNKLKVISGVMKALDNITINDDAYEKADFIEYIDYKKLKESSINETRKFIIEVLSINNNFSYTDFMQELIDEMKNLKIES